MIEDFKSLKEFRINLQKLMFDSTLRPFVCDGSPLNCKVFIVGFNPATTMNNSFWQYWNDNTGFDKSLFMKDYLKIRKLKGVRPRIERIVGQLPKGSCLETNICSRPTKTALELNQSDRVTEIFRTLFGIIKPKIVYAHSNDPVMFFQQVTGCEDFTSGKPKLVKWGKHSFYLLGTRGPLFRMSFDEATAIGLTLAKYLR